MMQASRIALRSSQRILSSSQTPAMLATSIPTHQARTFKNTVQSCDEEKSFAEKVKEQVNNVVEKAQEVLGTAKDNADETQQSSAESTTSDQPEQDSGKGEGSSSSNAPGQTSSNKSEASGQRQQ
eukprot:gb/GECG01008375.1/.p1 GENE.gb/GECG01008375.1/~~gb/GECG01008375.1/.p1  ORF type:complete len:125 (+),score=25.58 gb/GECG01008375.1/:1-375(+)